MCSPEFYSRYTIDCISHGCLELLKGQARTRTRKEPRMSRNNKLPSCNEYVGHCLYFQFYTRFAKDRSHLGWMLPETLIAYNIIIVEGCNSNDVVSMLTSS